MILLYTFWGKGLLGQGSIKDQSQLSTLGRFLGGGDHSLPTEIVNQGHLAMVEYHPT